MKTDMCSFFRRWSAALPLLLCGSSVQAEEVEQPVRYLSTGGLVVGDGQLVSVFGGGILETPTALGPFAATGVRTHLQAGLHGIAMNLGAAAYFAGGHALMTPIMGFEVDARILRTWSLGGKDGQWYWGPSVSFTPLPIRLTVSGMRLIEGVSQGTSQGWTVMVGIGVGLR